jgi:hypothetical protein
MIQFFMRLYALRFNRIWRKPVNHADICYKGVVWGTTARGFLPRAKKDAWEKASDLWIFKVPTSKDHAQIVGTLHAYCNRPYDFKNFWDFIVKLIIGRWKGKTGHRASQRLYCIEAVHIIIEILGDVAQLIGSWDNDPEESRQWAIDNLEFITKI